MYVNYRSYIYCFICILIFGGVYTDIAPVDTPLTATTVAGVDIQVRRINTENFGCR